jgi:hypothetical protein
VGPWCTSWGVRGCRGPTRDGSSSAPCQHWSPMAVGSSHHTHPRYVHIGVRVLRELRVACHVLLASRGWLCGSCCTVTGETATWPWRAWAGLGHPDAPVVHVSLWGGGLWSSTRHRSTLHDDVHTSGGVWVGCQCGWCLRGPVALPLPKPPAPRRRGVLAQVRLLAAPAPLMCLGTAVTHASLCSRADDVGRCRCPPCPSPPMSPAEPPLAPEATSTPVVPIPAAPPLAPEATGTPVVPKLTWTNCRSLRIAFAATTAFLYQRARVALQGYKEVSQVCDCRTAGACRPGPCTPTPSVTLVHTPTPHPPNNDVLLPVPVLCLATGRNPCRLFTPPWRAMQHNSAPSWGHRSTCVVACLTTPRGR